MTTPKEEAKEKTFTQADLDKAVKEGASAAVSKHQRDTAETRKQLRQLETKASRLESELEIARMAGSDEDEVAKARELQQVRLKQDERERDLAERETENSTREARLSAQLLSRDHGIPESELDKYDTFPEMKIAALEWKLEHGAPAAAMENSKAAVPEEEEMESSGNFDGGEGTRSRSTTIPNPVSDPEGWKKYEAKTKEAMSERARR